MTSPTHITIDPAPLKLYEERGMKEKLMFLLARMFGKKCVGRDLGCVVTGYWLFGKMYITQMRWEELP